MDKSVFKKKVLCIVVAFIVSQFLMVSGSIGDIWVYAGEHDDKMTVRVGYNDTGHYMYGTADGRNKDGYGYEYLQQLAYHGGWEYEYVRASFPEQLEMLKAGEIDLMINVSYTDERAEVIDYSEYPMGEEIYSLCVKPGSDISVSDLSTLSGKQVGATKNTYQVQLLRDWIAEKKLDCDLREVETVEEEQELDAFVSVNAYALGNWIPVMDIGSSEYYFGISKSKPAFLKKFNAAHRKILEANPYYNQELRTRYLGTAVISDELSPEERQWGENNPIIRLGYYEHYHEENSSQEHDKDGMVELMYDMLDHMAPHLQQHGMEIECFKFDSIQEMEKALIEGEIHMIFPVYGDLWMAEEKGYMLSSVIYSPSIMIFYKGAKPYASRYDTIAVVKGDPMQQPYVEDNYPGAEIVYYDNVLESMKAVKNEEVGCTIINSQVAEGLLQNNSGLRDLSFSIATNKKAANMCFGIAPGEQQLLSIINKEIKLLPQNFDENAINEYYMNLNEYQVNKGIFRTILILNFVLGILAIVILMYVRRIRRREKELIQFNEGIIEILGTVVEHRSHESGEHIWRVKELTRILAEYYQKHFPEYGLTNKDVDMIVEASVLHDVGKVSIPDSILLKPGKLTDDEFNEMKSHTEKGAHFLNSMKDKWDSRYQKVSHDICRYHHERFDGKGYPDGLSGDEIPISAQIVSIVDVYDALTHERCYKPKMSGEEAFAMIQNGDCGIFSPKLLEALTETREELEGVLKRDGC